METKMKVLVVVLICVVIFVFIQNKRLKEQGSQWEEEEEEVTCPSFESSYKGKEDIEDDEGVDLGSSISLGDYGKEVLYAQKRLNSQYGGVIAEDGKFGCETFFAVLNLTGYDSVGGFELNDLK